MTENSGIYTLQDFASRRTLKLAPDAFITVMGNQDMRVVVKNPRTNEEESSSKGMDFRAGITSINSTAGVEPGTGNCTVTIICPQYESMNQSYYLTQPNGVRAPFFTSMMEIRAYSKGRFLKNGHPTYYPTFWGFISSVNETHSGNETTFTLSCRDMLGWWEYQNVNIVPTPIQSKYTGKNTPEAGSRYRYMNPWEIILNLFKLTGMENFVAPAFMQGGSQIPPRLPFLAESEGEAVVGAYQALAELVIKDWENRFNFNKILTPSEKAISGVSNLEMFGVNNVIDISGSSNSPFSLVEKDSVGQAAKAAAESTATNTKELNALSPSLAAAQMKGKEIQVDKEAQQDFARKVVNGDYAFVSKQHQGLDKVVSPDFDILGKVLPFGNFEENSIGSEPIKMTKLEMASFVAAQINFEFYQDTNGMFVFKPPFYNMDVTRNPVYIIKAEDILSLDMAEDSSLVVTKFEVTGPIIYTGNTIGHAGVHIDFALMSRYGVRERSARLAFGNNPRTLRAMAVSEMAKANSNVFTANLTIVHRPELRLGYPVYIDHLDTFYYVKSISHSTTFGGATTTTLTLCARRTRVYDEEGQLLKGFIYKALDEFVPPEDKGDAVLLAAFSKAMFEARDGEPILRAHLEDKKNKESDTRISTAQDYASASNPVETYYRQNNLVSSPTPGFYTIVPSSAVRKLMSPSSDAASASKSLAEGDLTEVVRFTEDSIPYTDVNGFQHIGGFPYGATLVLQEDSSISDSESLFKEPVDMKWLHNLAPRPEVQGEPIVSDSLSGYQGPPTTTGGRLDRAPLNIDSEGRSQRQRDLQNLAEFEG